MIKLHRLNGSEIVINAELIESVDALPNTRIVLVTGNQYIVQENVDVVINKIRNEVLIKVFDFLKIYNK